MKKRRVPVGTRLFFILQAAYHPDMQLKKRHMAMPALTETLRECFTPHCGISSTTSAISTIR